MKIIMFEGGVETLTFFAREMSKTFIEKGVNVFFFNLKDIKGSLKRVRKFINSSDVVVLTFNFQGLSGEEYIYSKKTGYIWDEYNLRCINIVVDHPYYYEEQLRNVPKKYIHVSIDRNHKRYFEEYYKGYESRFLPLAGSKLYEDLEIKKIKDRSIDVLFAGNYVPLNICSEYIHKINEEYAQFYQGIIDELLVSPDNTLEEVAIRHIKREIPDINSEDTRLVLSKMIFIDLYIRNYMRKKVVSELVNAGIKVNVIGKDWDKTGLSGYKNFSHTDFSDSKTCMEAMRDSKLVLNVMPWFKDGAHDRVFNAILNGAVCISDKSIYQMEALKEGEGVSYYSLEEIKKLPDKIKDLLSNEAALQNMLNRGQKIVEKNHSWRSRAMEILQFLNWLE